MLLLGFSRFGGKNKEIKCSRPKGSAFTLAEVLITLGIIGVVAAMTLPTLVQSYKEKATVTHLKKVNSVLNQAYMQAKAEYGPVYDWFSSSSVEDPSGKVPAITMDNSKLLWERLSKYMKTTSVCYGTSGTCKRPQHASLGNNSSNKFSNARVVVKLPDGTWMYDGWIGMSNCSKPSSYCGDFLIDINGDKKPNTYGIDVFDFVITPKGIIPNGVPMFLSNVRAFPQYCNRKSSDSYNGFGCAAWIIYNENMDYLHCDDLSWDGKTKCK